MDNEHSYLIEYNNKIQSGEILAGKWVKLQYKLLANDINGSEYKFDLTESHKRIKFIETKCKHSISPFAGKPFMLELWEKAMLEAIYGFYMLIDGKWVRRFTHVLLLIGRKNGKTSFAAAIGNTEFFCGNIGTHIFCGSNDYEQAALAYDEINNMREESPTLEKVSRKTSREGICMGGNKQKVKKGKFSKQNKAKIKKMSAKGTGGKEGRNLDLAIIDETHEMKDGSLIKPLEQSASTKDEYLILEITTEGFVDDGHLDKELISRKEILKGEKQGKRKLSILYQQDCEEEIWQGEESWIKSNPNLGVSKKKQYLRDMLEDARTDSENRIFVLSKDFNFKQNVAAAWLELAQIINKDTFNLKEFEGAYYIGGEDFAETTDLCCFSAFFKKPNDKIIYMHQHFWIPNSKLLKSNDEESGAKYKEWADAGFITIVPENEVDTGLVAQYEYSLYKEYKIKPFKGGYDNRFAKDYIKKHKEIFGENILENVPQNAKCLSNPMRLLKENMKQHIINYQNNPVTEWCFKNCGVKVVGNLEQCMPVKLKRTKRIDGAAAAINCTHIFSAYKSDFMCLIDK